MTAVYVDADACPVKDEIVRVVRRHKIVAHMISNQWMRLVDDPLIRQVNVEQGPNITDNWIAERIGPSDIAVTADIPLAARCLDTGAIVMGPDGRSFTKASIGMTLAIRNLNFYLRETGEISGNNPTFSKKDRLRFLDALEAAVRVAKHLS